MHFTDSVTLICCSEFRAFICVFVFACMLLWRDGIADLIIRAAQLIVVLPKVTSHWPAFTYKHVSV